MSESSPFISILPEVLVPIVFFTGVVLIVFFILKARTRERLALIEKGIDVNLLVPKKSSESPLKTGLLLTGIGLGISIAFILSQAIGFDGKVTTLLVGALALLFGGLGLIIFHTIESKKA